MFDFARSLFDSDSLSPHGICLFWRPGLIWTHAISDALIGLAYLSIPLALGYIVSKRGDIVFGWIFWCFVIFILACGTTHFLSIATLWSPIYGIEALVKAFTALASVATAIALWRLLPRILALPSQEQLRAMNESLTVGIAERNQALRSLELANAKSLKTEDMLRQSQKMEAIGQLSSGVAHDFNNLLSVVVANLERIERHLPRDSNLQRPVSDAMTGVERAASVNQKLLAFARKQPLRPVDVEPNALIENLSDLLRGAVSAQTRVHMDLADDLWRVNADPNQLENAILNLVVNARDAIDAQTSATVSISTRNVHASDADGVHGVNSGLDYVLIEIADTGVGMSEDVSARAFEPFFTTKPLGHGSGLGLSQVFGFANQSGGNVTIASTSGQGTKVKIFLPRSASVKSDPNGVVLAPASETRAQKAFAGALSSPAQPRLAQPRPNRMEP